MILGASILQLPAIKQAAEMGLRVVALDMNPASVGFRVPGVIAETISTVDIEGALRAAEKYNIDGVMTLATDRPIRTAAAVAKRLGLVGVSEDTAVKATNKAVMRECLAAAGVPVPAFFGVSDENEFLLAAKRVGAPFMIKPVDSSGSRGILKVDSASDTDKIKEAYRYTKSFSNIGNVVVEEFMSGPEVSVETLAVDGSVNIIQITDKKTTGAPHFAETGHTQPTGLDSDTVSRIKEVAVAANKAIGITDGPSHTEIIVTRDGPKVVEIGARLGGDCITTHLVPLSTGVNMVEACIRIALGEKPDLTSRFSKGAAIRYFAQHTGVVKSIDGVDEASKMPGIKQISIVHGVGEKVTEVIDSVSRMGFVIAQGEDARDAQLKCESAVDRIKVEIE